MWPRRGRVARHRLSRRVLVSVKPIRLFGDPVLRTPAEPVCDFDAELRRLVKDLTETMLDAPGAGLAAPQIGVGLRVFAYHVDDNEPGHLINPSLALSEDTDLLARCIQHETDHLDGILFIDRMDPAQRKAAMKAIREAEWWGDPIPQ